VSKALDEPFQLGVDVDTKQPKLVLGWMPYLGIRTRG